MPAVSAIILSAHVTGRRGVKQLLGRLKIWRIDGGKKHLRLFAIIALYPILLVAAGLLFNIFDPQSTVKLLPLMLQP